MVVRRVDKVKTWLSNTCSYRDIYEHRLRQRHPDSCAWFLGSEQYCKWKSAPFNQATVDDAEELERTWQDRVLFVQAKPGFGKSYISGAVIDDLSTEADNLNIDEEYEPPTIAYFHFNASHSYCVHPNDAFRALAYQLIHSHRHDRSTLDTISLLMRKTPSDARASSDDVLTLLGLLLHQHPTFLVIDGLDECSDVQLFLTSLPEVCRKSDTRTMLFSRPDIEIPREYQRWASDSPYIFRLGEDSNTEDIKSYLGEKLSRMADQGFFGINMDRSIIGHVSGRANSMFLWASLLLKYLQSPGLTPDERRTVLYVYPGYKLRGRPDTAPPLSPSRQVLTPFSKSFADLVPRSLGRTLTNSTAWNPFTDISLACSSSGQNVRRARSPPSSAGSHCRSTACVWKDFRRPLQLYLVNARKTWPRYRASWTPSDLSRAAWSK